MSWQQIHLQPRRRWPNVQSRKMPRSFSACCPGSFSGPLSRRPRSESRVQLLAPTLFITNDMRAKKRRNSNFINDWSGEMQAARRHHHATDLLCGCRHIARAQNSDRFSFIYFFFFVFRRPASRREKFKRKNEDSGPTRPPLLLKGSPMVINDYSLFFSYRSWVLFPPSERYVPPRHNQHTSNHLHTPGPAAEWWIVQVCKRRRKKENSYHSSCSLLLRAWNNIAAKIFSPSPGWCEVSSTPLLV